MAVAAGAAFISVLPDMSGFNRAVRTDLDKIGPQIGVRLGQQIGKGIAEGLGKSDPFGPLDRKQQEQQRKAPRDGDAQAGAFASAFSKRLKAAFASLPKAQIDADASPADRRLQELRARLEALSKKTIGVDIDAAAALGELAAVKADLESLSHTAPVNVRADVASALAQIGAVEREVEKVGGQTPTVTVDADTAAADAELAVTDREVSRLDGRTANINVNANVGGALAGLFSVRTALLSLGAVAAPAVIGVGAGLLGLAGPLAAAGAGFGGLAAVAIPALSHIKAALGEQNKAQQSSAASSGQAQQRALAQAGAEQQLAAAVRQAAYAHQQALQQVQQAEQQLTQAQQAATNAQRDLTKARADAARQLQDMSNNVTDAKLSERQATFDLQDAQNKYNQTVANPQATRDQIARAKLALDQAKQQLAERHLATQRAIADEKAAAKAGVDGSDQVRTARQRLAQADLQITNAERALSQARANVARTDQQSADQVAAARRGLEQASLSASSATGSLGAATAKLTPLEQQALVAVKGLSSAFREWSTALQPAVLPTLIAGINLVKASLPLLTPIVQSAAGAVGNLFRQAQAAASSPFWRQFSAFLGQAAGPAITQFGSIFGRLVTGLAGLVQAFAPIGFAFLTVLNAVAARFQAFATGLATSPGFQAFVTQMTNLAPLLASTFSTIGSLLGSVLAGLAPAVTPAIAFINTLGTTLTGVVRAIGPAVQSVLATLGPALGSVVQALGPVLTQLVQALAPLLVQLINGLAPILTGLAPIVGTLISALQPLISGLLAALGPILLSLVPLVATLARAFAQVLGVIAPILAPLGQLITQLVQALLPVLQPIITLVAQVSASIGRQMVGAILSLMPSLIIVVKAIASLLPAITPLIPLVAQLATAFLPLIPPLAQLIAALVTLLVPILRVLIVVVAFVVRILLSALVPVIRLLVVVIVAVVNAITIAVRALGPIFTWLYQVIVKPVVDGIVIAFRALATAATWLWSNVLSPVFTVIGTAAKVMAAIILFIVVAPLIVAFKLIAATVGWLWTNVIKPYFTFIGAYTSAVWHNVIRPALSAFVSFINSVVAPAVRWLYNSIVRPLFSSIGSAISSVWNGVIRPAFNALSSAIGAVGTAFGRGASAIRSAWDRVKGYTKDPINFVIGTVYNRGIVGLWNKVMGWLHLPGSLKLGEVPLLASGGTLGNPMQAHPFVTNGPTAIVGEGRQAYPEFVIPTDPRYRGRAQALWAAAGSKLQMLAGGGILGGVLGGVKKIAGGVLNLVKDAVTFIANPKAIWDKLAGPILSQAGGLRTSPWGNAAAAIPGQLGAQAWNALAQIVKAWNDGYGGDAKGVVAAAKKYIGVGDDRGANNNIFSRAFGMPGAPWCFAAGTLVQTPTGLRPIEEIEVGDEVVSPSGEHIQVATLYRREKPLVLVSALGVCETAATADHPYWTRRRLSPRNRLRVMGQPEWIRAGDLQRGDMIAKPIPASGDAPVDDAFAQLVGLYVAEGYRTDRDHSVTLCVSRSEFEDVGLLVKEAGYEPHVAQHRTCTLVTIYDRALYDLLEAAGRGAANKRVPQFVFDWNAQGRAEFVRGYVRGDGHKPGRYPGRIVCQTISRALTVSLSGLLLTLRVSAGVRMAKRAGAQVIEGRTVNCREKYTIEWSEDQGTVSLPQFIWEEDRLWVPVRGVQETDRVERVYDLTVPGEHAFIADGAHVSNCAMFASTAIKDAHATSKYPGAPTAAVATFASNMNHVGLDQGRPGDLAIYYSPPHHVNIIESKTSGGYMTIGGNQNALVQRGVRGGQTGILRPLARGGTLTGNDVWQVFGREAVGNADPHELSTPLVRLMRSLAPGTMSQVASAITKNHLGVVDAAYDAGGYLPPGMSTVWNGTGVPEPVLTSSQWDSIHAAAGGGGRDIRQFEGSTFVMNDPVDVDLVMQRAEFAARAAAL